MPNIVRIAQLMFLYAPWVENIVIFAIRAAVSEIQLILALNGKLALIGYKLGHNYLTEYPIGLYLWRTTPAWVPKDHFWESRPKLFFVRDILHHHALFGQNCPINDSLTPWCRKYRYFSDPNSRFRDTAVFNFKW